MKTFEGKFNKNSKGVFAISLVNQPATEETFIAMSKQEKVITLSKVDGEQRILMGLVLQPNQMIPRIDEKGDEYQMYFSAETIKEYSENFFKSGFQLNSKLEHETPIEGVTFVESWIVENPKVDKSYNFGMEYPKGSWIATMKVDNDDIWNNYVKTGELQGFSIDAMVELEEVKENEFNFKSNINMSEKNKSILTKIKELVMSTEVVDAEVVVATPEETVTFGSVKSDDLDIQFEGETLEVGSSVYLMDGDEKVALADGNYVLESGETLVVKEGVAEALDAKAEEESPEPEAVEEKELAEEDEEKKEDEEVKEEEEEVKELEEEVAPEEAPAAMTEEDVRRIVEEMVMGFKSEVEALRSENTELKSEVVSLSKTPIAAPIASTPTQMSAHGHVLDMIKRRK